MTNPRFKHSRVDTEGRALAGSQRQIQSYVNDFPDELEAEICKTLRINIAPVMWVSPLRSERYVEYRDFDALHALGLDRFRDALARFWPVNGPSWDALGLIKDENGDHSVILVEGKSHPSEMCSSCKAGYSSRPLIRASLDTTKGWLNVNSERNWLSRYYQYANRIAFLYFFREICRVPAYLANVYFTGDSYRPTTLNQWKPAIADVRQHLGVPDIPFAGDVFVPAKNDSNTA